MLIGIFENEFVHCDLDDDVPVLRHKWLSPPPPEEFKFNLKRILDEYIQLHKTYRNLAWLANAELLGELDLEVEEWLVGEWETLLFDKAGVKIHAVVLGASIFADYPMERFKQDAEEKHRTGNVKLGVFSNEKEAYTWIRQQVNA
ncbi:MAG: hypothetical protein JNK10_04265 [Cyclobacteriaceae bacterium]|nr:hypothetical protein [Cyclobacteriaceae bacterium]